MANPSRGRTSARGVAHDAWLAIDSQPFGGGAGELLLPAILRAFPQRLLDWSAVTVCPQGGMPGSC